MNTFSFQTGNNGLLPFYKLYVLNLKTKTKHLRAGPENVCVINFESEGFDEINLSTVFLCQDIILQLLEQFQTFYSFKIKY